MKFDIIVEYTLVEHIKYEHIKTESRAKASIIYLKHYLNWEKTFLGLHMYVQTDWSVVLTFYRKLNWETSSAWN